MDWEYFEDKSYYDLWAVRPVGETRWGACFHLHNKEEAEMLSKLLTAQRVPNPF
jgi:hypothetical protein